MPIQGVNGEYVGTDPLALASSTAVCLTNIADANPVVGGTISLTYPELAASYDITIVAQSPPSGSCADPDNAAECIVMVAGDAPAPLPVELAEFSINDENCTNKIEWTTLSEVGTAYFEIERSADGVQFEMIQELAAIGGPTKVTSYKFVDNVVIQTNFYRLKIIDLDGSVQFSQIIANTLNCERFDANFRFYPNAFRSLATIEFHSDKVRAPSSVIELQ